MDSAERWTNTPYLPDTLEFITAPGHVNSDTVASLYLGEKLSAAQIAKRAGISKATVLHRLHAAGIRKVRTGRDPDAYQHPHNPPFGQQVIEGRLAPDRREMKAVRLIVELRDRRQLSWRATGEWLNENGYRIRNGKTWSIGTVRAVYARWHGKL